MVRGVGTPARTRRRQSVIVVLRVRSGAERFRDENPTRANFAGQRAAPARYVSSNAAWVVTWRSVTPQRTPRRFHDTR